MLSLTGQEADISTGPNTAAKVLSIGVIARTGARLGEYGAKGKEFARLRPNPLDSFDRCGDGLIPVEIGRIEDESVVRRD